MLSLDLLEIREMVCSSPGGLNLTPEARTALGIPEGRTLETLQAELQAKAQAAQAQM